MSSLDTYAWSPFVCRDGYARVFSGLIRSTIPNLPGVYEWPNLQNSKKTGVNIFVFRNNNNDAAFAFQGIAFIFIPMSKYQRLRNVITGHLDDRHGREVFKKRIHNAWGSEEFRFKYLQVLDTLYPVPYNGERQYNLI